MQTLSNLINTFSKEVSDYMHSLINEDTSDLDFIGSNVNRETLSQYANITIGSVKGIS